MVLAPGGSFCTKQYTYFSPLNTSLIILLSNLFKEFYIIKPETSRPTNSEIYLLGKGYIGLLGNLENKLLDIMSKLREIGTPDCANYSFYNYTPRIKPNLDRLVDISRNIFISIQSKLLINILDIIETNNADLEIIRKLVNPIHLAKMDRYITINNINKLEWKDRLNTKSAERKPADNK